MSEPFAGERKPTMRGYSTSQNGSAKTWSLPAILIAVCVAFVGQAREIER